MSGRDESRKSSRHAPWGLVAVLCLILYLGVRFSQETKMVLTRTSQLVMTGEEETLEQWEARNKSAQLVMTGEVETLEQWEARNKSAKEITIDPDLLAWRIRRNDPEIYASMYKEKEKPFQRFRYDADKDGPMLDFIVEGFAKCGTSAVVRTLAHVTTTMKADICAQLPQVMHWNYHNWAEEFGRGAMKYSVEKPLKGYKCPMGIENFKHIRQVSERFPKTKVIVGIRHPVRWFGSLLNMRWASTGQKNITGVEYTRIKLADKGNPTRHFGDVTVERSKFYVSLYKLGKTQLGAAERDLLNISISESEKVKGTRNDVFLYDSTQGKNEYFYEELARFVGIHRWALPPLTNTTHKTGYGRNKPGMTEKQLKSKKGIIDICLPEYDFARKLFLPVSHRLGEWLVKYVIPAALERDDLTIPNATDFAEIVKTTYGKDPCDNRLIRNETDGEYY